MDTANNIQKMSRESVLYLQHYLEEMERQIIEIANDGKFSISFPIYEEIKIVRMIQNYLLELGYVATIQTENGELKNHKLNIQWSNVIPITPNGGSGGSSGGSSGSGNTGDSSISKEEIWLMIDYNNETLKSEILENLKIPTISNPEIQTLFRVYFGA